MTWTMKQKIFLRHITKLSLPRLFQQNTEGTSISTHFQTRVKFSSRSRNLRLMALLKIVGQQIPHHLGL